MYAWMYVCLFLFFFFIKRVLAKGQQKYVRKIPLVARPCKDDSRRNRGRGWRSSLVWEVSCHSSFERVQVIGRWKSRQRKRVPEFTSVRDEWVKIMFNSCIRKMDIIGMRRSKKSCAVRPQERWGHACMYVCMYVSMYVCTYVYLICIHHSQGFYFFPPF